MLTTFNRVVEDKEIKTSVQVYTRSSKKFSRRKPLHMCLTHYKGVYTRATRANHIGQFFYTPFYWLVKTENLNSIHSSKSTRLLYNCHDAVCKKVTEM